MPACLSLLGILTLSYPHNALANPIKAAGNLLTADTLYLSVENQIDEPVETNTLRINELNATAATGGKPLVFGKKTIDSDKARIVAIGGSLAAGVQNGGLYRASQLTSYPNLIARQMGAAFRQPLFSAEEANGAGYKLLIREDGPVFRYSKVSDKLAVDPKSNAGQFRNFEGEIDNLALPFHNVRGSWKDLEYYSRLALPSMESQDFIPYFKRILPVGASDKSSSYLQYVEQRATADFVIFDPGMDGHLQSALVGGDASQLPQLEEGERGDKSEFRIVKNLAAKGAKGVLVTIPNVIEFPYFKMYTPEKLAMLQGEGRVSIRTNRGTIRSMNDRDVLLPSAKVEALFSGRSSGEVLGERESLAVDEGYDETAAYRNVNWYNEYYVKFIAKENDFAVFDLYALLKKINAGGYVTDDGVEVNPAFPDGNFYSDDAIHPTSFGQAVIANECIKAINEHYGSGLPLLNTREFLK
ncbi:hypothetical protein GCM10010967_12810 [Dyadobacter beijingensis]|uniref:GDSL-like Lipase/Acylhydrolase n=1 Tax=Dyadobacter beijingensis TaxID=365489 RepID=A0ABQ2HJD0_9BACT|nr:hypothetical protein GCM10010967_12810 [Dyadobacter beijingensis]